MSASSTTRQVHPGWLREVSPRWELRPAPAHPGGPDLFVVAERVTFLRIPLHPDHLEQVRYRKISTPLPYAEANAILHAREHAADNAERATPPRAAAGGYAHRAPRRSGADAAAHPQLMERLVPHGA